MILVLLGRIPALGIAECERVFGSENVEWFSDTTALIKTDSFFVEKFGGVIKAARVVAELPHANWSSASKELIHAYSDAWRGHEHKITLGLSAYGFGRLDSRDVQKAGLALKQKLKSSPGSLRLVPNETPALSSATSHHNKLGLSDNKVELLIVRDARSDKVIIAESVGAQNITALARRDQGRPKRDAFVGMLPPKLALTIVNIAVGNSSNMRVLDPFCGTGVILQEAALLGHKTYGTDLSEKMVNYSQQNMDWLASTHHIDAADCTVAHGDAMTTTWQTPIDVVACESYLGQPFSAPPSPSKLTEVRGNCNHIISAFLRNIASQLKSGTPLCVAIPAWRSKSGGFTFLPLPDKLEKLGYRIIEFKNISERDLLYYREDQVVARELLVLEKI